MRNINFNYAATSAIKPKKSIDAMIDYLESASFNSPSRGGEASLNEGRLEFSARDSLCRLFNVKKSENVIFTLNVTTALNMIICGIAEKGCHIISTSLEHNAVARPLELLREKGIIELSYVQADSEGFISPNAIKEYFKPNTKLVVMTHASNVTGGILPYEAFAKEAKEHGALFVLDAAQTAGLIPIDFDNSDMDVCAFTGHKSLMGPGGIGGFIVKSHAAKLIRPYITGGTGSVSHLLSQPEFLPDKFESGTPNMLGIIGLGASVDFILETGLKNIYEHEIRLTRQFLEGLQCLPKIKIYGTKDISLRTPVVSFNIENEDNGLLSQRLYEEFGISLRSGLHCSPLAHKTLGTYPNGALRASFGFFTTEEEIAYGLDAIEKIIKTL